MDGVADTGAAEGSDGTIVGEVEGEKDGRACGVAVMGVAKGELPLDMVGEGV